MAPMIALSDIRFSYNGHAHSVFENLSLEIPAGSATAILRPNMGKPKYLVGSGRITVR